MVLRQGFQDSLDGFITPQGSLRYSADDEKTWQKLFDRGRRYSAWMHPAVIDGLTRLSLRRDQIPRIDVLAEKLRVIGWSAAPVTGLLPSWAFFGFLSRRIFPVSIGLRDGRQLEFSPEPDLFHESFGHLPMLFDENYRDFVWKLATIASENPVSSVIERRDRLVRELSHALFRNADPTTISQIRASIEAVPVEDELTPAEKAARLLWWVAEYGVQIGLKGEMKAFGGALISSAGEMESLLANDLVTEPISQQCLALPYDPVAKVWKIFSLRNFSELDSLLMEVARTTEEEVSHRPEVQLNVSSLEPEAVPPIPMLISFSNINKEIQGVS